MSGKELINSIPESHRHTIEVYSDLIAQRTIRNDKAGADEYRKMLRGYLTCMKDARMITETGRGFLQLWYGSDRVRVQIREGAVK
jgi:hypothetical protein